MSSLSSSSAAAAASAGSVHELHYNWYVHYIAIIIVIMVMISMDYLQSAWSTRLHHHDLYRAHDHKEHSRHLRDWSTLHQQRGKASRGARQSCVNEVRNYCAFLYF